MGQPREDRENMTQIWMALRGRSVNSNSRLVPRQLGLEFTIPTTKPFASCTDAIPPSHLRVAQRVRAVEKALLHGREWRGAPGCEILRGPIVDGAAAVFSRESIHSWACEHTRWPVSGA